MLLAWVCYISLCYRLLWNVPLTTKCFYEERGFTVRDSELFWIFLRNTILRCVRLTTLPPSCAVVMKYGNLNFLELSGPLQACNGTALPLPFSEELPNGLRNLPDVSQYGARANTGAAGASNKEASRVCLSHCKNCIHVASITFTLRFPKHEFLPRTTFCRDVQFGRTSTARNCPSCATFRDRQITSGAINTCSAAVNATGIYDHNDAETRFGIRRCEYLMQLKGIHAEEI
jgi:hypothetical protein